MKRLISLLCVLCLLLATCTASAAGNSGLKIQNVRVTDNGSIQATVFSPQVGTLKPDDFAVTLDEKNVKASSVSYYQNSQLGTNWFFIIDMSMNMEMGRRLSKTKAMVKSLIENLGPFDSAAIVPTGTTSFTLSSDQKALNRELDAIERGDSTKKALYSQIGLVLNHIETSTELKGRSAIVVFSTGENENETGMSKSNLNSLLTTSDATIYTVALLNNKPKRANVNSFSDMADISCGGLAQEIESGVSSEDMSGYSGAILQQENLFRLMEIPAAEQKVSGSELVIVSLSDKVRGSAKYQLSQDQAARIQKAIPTPVPATPTPTKAIATPTPTATKAASATAAPTATATAASGLIDQFNEWPAFQKILLIAAVLVVIAVIVMLIVRGKKKAAPEMPPFAEDEQESEDKTEVAPPTPGPSTLMVTLEAVGLDEPKVFSSPMVNELIIGRSSERGARLIIPDKKVSGKHCRLTYANKSMYIEDLNSSNGTKVNGMTVQGNVVLQQNDLITLGLTNVRITWKKA